MGKGNIPKVKKKFKFLPAWVWCIIIDLTDIVSNIISVLISSTGITIPAGIGFDLVFDLIQIGGGLIIFDDVEFAALNPDLLLPQAFDIFPSYTAKYIYRRWFV